MQQIYERSARPRLILEVLGSARPTLGRLVLITKPVESGGRPLIDRRRGSILLSGIIVSPLD